MKIKLVYKGSMIESMSPHAVEYDTAEQIVTIIHDEDYKLKERIPLITNECFVCLNSEFIDIKSLSSPDGIVKLNGGE